MGKRVFDLLFCLVGMLVLSPFLILIGIAIKFGDGGPVFFHQIRVGLKGRHFHILKFRSMHAHTDPGQPSITAYGDPRITRVGYWLRRTKLDELPQLWNIFRGEMSFVGPRPEVPQYVALYTDDQRAVLRLKPGITDEASIEFRDEEKLLAAAPDRERFYVDYCLPRKIALNLAYARRASVLGDIGIILRTLRAVWLKAPPP